MAFLAAALCVALLFSGGGVTAAPKVGEQQQALHVSGGGQGQRRLHGRFLHITDFHPDEHYKAHTSVDKACHRGKGHAGVYGAETSDCDSPFSLVDATFDWIEANLKDQVDFVIWTGDNARHDSDEKIPRSRSEVIGTNRRIADKFADSFSDPGGNQLTIPIIPTLGNNDFLPHNILHAGPNEWLQEYAEIWRRFIPEEQRHSFEYGGWFYVEVVPNKLAVFSLNTMYMFDRNAAIDNCAKPSEPGFKLLAWLRIQLAFMRQRGMKAILMGHVPPARTPGKQLWDETCWQEYTLWLQQYRDVVVGSLYGHMNIDHFLLQDSRDIQIGMSPGEESERTNGHEHEAMGSEVSVQSKTDYLQELRSQWSKLPKPESSLKVEAGLGKEDKGKTKKKKKKNKKPKDPWGERYQLSLIGPSVIPNYYPTLRVFEYNITGLEDILPWADVSGDVSDVARKNDAENEETRLELRNGREVVSWPGGGEEEVVEEVEEEMDEMGEKSNRDDNRDDNNNDNNSGSSSNKKKKNNKNKKKKKGKGKRPKDPDLVIPDPPAKSAPPGPAYSPQPLTLTGYTQYFANLTRINSEADAERGPGQFGFEVEYSTFSDEVYNLSDLTVKSIMELAYTMGMGHARKKGDLTTNKVEGDAEDQELELGGAGDQPARAESDAVKKKADKIWLHFLRHAFVSTVDREELEKLC